MLQSPALRRRRAAPDPVPPGVASDPVAERAGPPPGPGAGQPATPPRRRRPALRTVLLGATVAVGGALAGVALAVASPTHMEIAGTDATIRLHPGRAEDRVALSGELLTGRRATDRSVLGEPLGVTVRLELDPSTFISSDGSFNADVIPAYIQAYSDPEQLARDLRWALTKHLLTWCAAGAAAAVAAWAARRALREWRWQRGAALGGEQHRAALAYWAPERMLRRRAAAAVVLLAAIDLMPSGRSHAPPPPRIEPSALLTGTPLAGTEVGGLLAPALTAVRNYITTYFADTDAYYNQLRDRLLAKIRDEQLTLPGGPDVANVVFVTDRHCNIGMDRVVVAVAEHYGLTVLVSGGDDDFSGSFQFESACTKNLAAKSQQAGMTDVFVAGNHDSAMTIADERNQHVKVLDGTPVTVDGLTFAGLPDPRSSRYGQGIQPASETERHRLLVRVGRETGRIACNADGPVVVVLHDPIAGNAALQNGCGRATLALDGHTHLQIGPTPVALPATGAIGYQFVGGSTGGAPGEGAVERTFASRLTVGPLNHRASFDIVSIDRATGALVGVTTYHFTPLQDITVEQRRVP